MGLTFAQKVSRWQTAANVLARAEEAGVFDDISRLRPEDSVTGRIDSVETRKARHMRVRERIIDLIGFLEDVTFTIRDWSSPKSTPEITFHVGGYDGQ